MPLEDRVIAAVRARFWLHFVYYHTLNLSKKFPDLYSTKRSFLSPPSLQTFNRLCDTLVLLVLAYSEYYPSVPWSIHNVQGFPRRFLRSDYSDYIDIVNMDAVASLRPIVLLRRTSNCIIFNSTNTTSMTWVLSPSEKPVYPGLSAHSPK